MKIEIEAEWGPLDDPWSDNTTSSQMKIGGCTATVSFRGDVWEWIVVSNGGWSENGSGWVDSEGEAKAVAETTIRGLLK